jgi:hypothetical protein
MLAEFDKAFSEFERDAYSFLHESHFDPGTDLAGFKVQIQAQSLATDVGYLSMVMRDLHQAAIGEASDEMESDNADYQRYLKQRMAEAGPGLVLDDQFFRNRPSRERTISIALAKLGAAFKAFLFPIRAYQDAVYKVGLRILGQHIGGESGMKSAVNIRARTFVTTNPIGDLLARSVPEYALWFASLRGQRDFIKYGAGVSYSSAKNFVTGETTVAVRLHTSSENEQPSISLDDVSRALQMSTGATRAIIHFGVARGKLSPRSGNGVA